MAYSLIQCRTGEGEGPWTLDIVKDGNSLTTVQIIIELQSLESELAKWHALFKTMSMSYSNDEGGNYVLVFTPKLWLELCELAAEVEW